MMIFLYRIVIVLSLIAVLSGCSLFGDNEPEYLDSVESYPLRVPEGLDDPTGAAPVVISIPQMRMPAGDELEPLPPRVVTTAGREDANAYLAWSAEGAYLKVKDTPESVSRRLGFAIQPADYSGTFMTLLKPDGNDTRVYLLFGNGEVVDTAGTEHILAIFMERFG